MMHATNDTLDESRLLAEETVRPFSAVVPVILWIAAFFFITSTTTSFFEPLPEFVPDWLRMINGAFDIFGVIFVPLIALTIATIFTVIFFMFPGVRYRIFTDRIEYQRGTHLCLYPLQKITFGEWQTLVYSELKSIYWTVQGISDENPPDTMFIEFHFVSRKFQLHACFDLDDHVAEACRMIERDTIVPKILRALEDGKTVPFLPADKSFSYEIEINDKMIRDWNQRCFSWDEIGEIRFSKGKASWCCNYLAQSRICIKSTSGETMEFDMPRHNPHALWAVIKSRCSLSTLQVLSFPKKENV
jgi:hypothetical protein